MSSVMFQEWAKRFAEQGRIIEEIHSKSAILFSVHPFLESFLGWDRATLSHFTVLDCLPLTELSEADVVSGSPKLRVAIREAISAMKLEEEHISSLKNKQSIKNNKKNQMEWS